MPRLPFPEELDYESQLDVVALVLRRQALQRAAQKLMHGLESAIFAARRHDGYWRSGLNEADLIAIRGDVAAMHRELRGLALDAPAPPAAPEPPRPDPAA